jgi:hypothetical protein
LTYISSRREAGERDLEIGDSVAGEGRQFVGIEEVLFGMAAAEEEHRSSDRRALALEPGALLEESAKRGEARAGADHNDRGRLGQAERRLGVLHEA